VEPIPDRDYVIIDGMQRGYSVGERVNEGRAMPKDALPLPNGEMPRVIRTIDALRMKVIPCTPIICAGNP
jgi:hypothetical protein